MTTLDSCAATALLARLALLVLAGLALAVPQVQAQSFTSSGLPSSGLSNPTSLQFGPDQRLYVSEQDGDIKVFTLARSAPGSYSIAATELITQIKSGTANHNDDGGMCDASPCSGGQCTRSCSTRQVTGILVTGSASEPVLYVTSSDSGYSVSYDSELDTNSGVITRMTCSGGISAGQCLDWDRVDIVRGLPRSEENHATNGMALDAASNTLYVTSGGNTNKGARSNNFAGLPEYFLAGAVLSVDLDAIAAIEAANGGPFTDQRTGTAFVYDLVTLDDPTRANIDNSDPGFPYEAGHPRYGLQVDPGDPFGGNDGLNQAIPEPGGPVQVHSPGYRNPYDVVFTEGGELYTWDNGPNSGWGGTPLIYTSAGAPKGYIGQSGVTYSPGSGDYCTDEFNEQGSDTEGDTLVHITGSSYYGGHPAPTRAFPEINGLGDLLPAGYGLDIGDFPNDPRQCDYQRLPIALEVISASTNGLAEYTASNFGGAMQGDLIATAYNGNLYRCKPAAGGGLVDLGGSADGTTHGKCEVLFGGFSSIPLDVTTQGDGEVFPGTVWMAAYLGGVTVFEPVDFGTCDPSDPSGDSDGDGYSNGDEADNGTNACSAGDQPADFDGDFVSNLNDADDDDDGISDVSDAFALDADNGLATALPLNYPLFNNDPGTGLFGLGFTGLMVPLDASTTWLDMYDPEALAAGGTAGLFTVEQVSAGDALGASNTQDNGFLFGVDADTGTAPFLVRTRLMPPYFEVGGSQSTPQPAQSYGLFIGTGDQDNYVKIAIQAGSGGGGVQVLREVGGTASATSYDNAAWGGANLLAAAAIDLQLAIDPQALTVLPRISLDGGGSWHALGSPLPVPAAWLSAADARGLAIGAISTARDPDSTPQGFGATWDFFSVAFGAVAAVDGEWVSVDDFDAERHEGGFVQAGSKFYLLGGREADSVRIYDPATGNWSTGASSPIKLHHFQAVVVDGLIYVVGAMTGSCCQEPEAPNVYIYDPVANAWATGPAIPAARARGAGGAVAVGGKIYWVSGNTDGHFGPVSAKVDVFDPATGSFTALADIPHPRDHFFLVHRSGKLYAAGGRITNIAADSDPHDDQVAQVDVYDIASGSWSTLPSSANVPIPRSGAATAILGDELVLAGGESNLSSAAHAETQAFDFGTQTWRDLASMLTPRHSAQALVSNGGLYVAAGSDQRDGPSGAHLDLEALYLDGVTAPAGTAIDPSLLSAPASVDFGEVTPGGYATRTITVSNTSGDQGIVVTGAAVSGSAAFALELPPAMPFVLAPGQSRQFKVGFSPSGPGNANATLTVQRLGGANAVVALAGKATAAAASADLSVSIVEDSDPVAEGASLVYTVTVHNAGPDAATDAFVETALSPLLSAPTTVGCGGDPDGVPTCELGDIPVGGEVVWLLSVDVDADAGGSVAETTVVVAAMEEDPDASDNDATASTDIGSGAPSDIADLSIEKSAQTAPGSVVYTLVVANAGPAAVSDASVVDLVPAGLSGVQWTCSAGAGAFCTAAGSGSIDELVDLQAGASLTFTLTAQVADGEPRVNTAMVNVPAGVTDPDPQDNESSAWINATVFADGFESP